MKDIDYKYKLLEVLNDYDTKPDKNIIISQDYRTYKRYFLWDTKYNLDITKDNNLYEVVRYKDGYCYKLYFDIERTIPNQDDIILKYENYLKKFLKQIRNIISDKLKYNYGEDVVLTASRQIDKDTYKISYHIISPVYLSAPYEVYNLVAYLILYLGSTNPKYNICDEFITMIDKSVYRKQKIKSSLNFRILGQTKINNPESLLKSDKKYNIYDTLITQTNTKDKNILILPEEVYNKLKCKNNELETLSNRVANGTPYDNSDIIMLNLPKYKNNINYTTNILLEYYKKYGIGTNQDINIYLDAIPNTPEKRMPYNIWFNIGAILKKINVEYSIFEKWTTKSYLKDIDDVKRKCRDVWENKIDLNKCFMGLYHIIGIALKYQDDLYVNMSFAKNILKKYNIDKTNDGKWENIKIENGGSLDIIKYYKEGYSAVITDANVGYGKTNDVISLVKENIKEDIFMIVFTNRKLFSTEISAKFENALLSDIEEENEEEKVFNYDENRGKKRGSLTNKKVLAVSYESLLFYIDDVNTRLKHTTKLILLFDENETLLKNLTQADILRQPYETMGHLLDLWERSNFNIVLDAFLTKNSIDFVDKMNYYTKKSDKVAFLNTENYNKYPKKFIIKAKEAKPKKDESNNKLVNKIAELIINILNSDKKNSVVLFCEKRKYLDAIFECIMEKVIMEYGEYLINTGDTTKFDPPNVKRDKLEIFKNKKLFEYIRFWGYTSTILNGISIENKRFTKEIVLFSQYTINFMKPDIEPCVGMYANDIINGLSRARLNDEVLVYIETGTTAKQANSFWNKNKCNWESKKRLTYDEYLNNNKRDKNILVKDNILTDTDLTDEERDEKIKKLDILTDYLSKKDVYLLVIDSDYVRVRINPVYLDLKKPTKEEEIILKRDLFKIEKSLYIEYKQMDMLDNTKSTYEMLEIINKNNLESAEINSIWKTDIFSYLAKDTNNIVIDESDNFTDGGVKVCMDILNVSSMNNMEIEAVSIITNKIKKYYGDDERSEKIIKYCRDNIVNKYIDRYITIKELEKTTDYNPSNIILVLKTAFNIEKGVLKELPKILTDDYIKTNNLYEKTKSIFDEIRAIDKKRKLKEVVDNKKASCFINNINGLLDMLGYRYAKLKKNYNYYDLLKPKIERTLKNENGDKLKDVLSADELEYIWDYTKASGKYTFINDDEYVV